MKFRYVVAAGVFVLWGTGVACVAIAKHIIGVDPLRREPLQVVAVDDTSSPRVVSLPLNAATGAPGQYAIWFDSGRGYAQVGRVVAVDERASLVVREVTGSHGTPLRAGQSARWSGVVPSRATDVGLPFTAVAIPTALGAAPAYRFDAPPDPPQPSTWAVHVHGQGATRAGPLRGVPITHRAGLASLVVSYRNDQEAPNSRDRKSMLGQTEWRDVDAALDYAVAQGAESLILVGWSMGAMIALQLARSSSHRDRISGLCLIAPVTDWRSTILAAGRRARVPAFMIRLALRALGSMRWGRATGLTEAVNLSNLDWIHNGGDLRIPTIVLHSAGDRSVPIALSRAFRDAHKDVVELVELPTAPHTLEANRSPELWEGAFSEWLSRLTSRESTRSLHRRDNASTLAQAIPPGNAGSSTGHRAPGAGRAVDQR